MTITAEIESGTQLDFQVFGHTEKSQGGSYEGWDFEVLEEYKLDSVYFNGIDVTDKLNSKWWSAVEEAAIAKL